MNRSTTNTLFYFFVFGKFLAETCQEKILVKVLGKEQAYKTF